jgi:hypothetical protein
VKSIADQFINLGEPISDDTRIYRVFSKERLFEMFTEKKLSLVTPTLWDDPFENFLAKAKVTLNGMPNVRIGGIFRNFYGQCWTLNSESDAMWRIYSHRKDGARVSTTVGRLLRSICDPADPFASMSYYIGSVAYHSEAELRRFFEDPENVSSVTFDPTGRGQAMTLFFKRQEFAHEREVRLLYRFSAEGESEQRPEQVWQFPIDPDSLFDDVLFDPRMEESALSTEERQLRVLGFTKEVRQSTLYKLPGLKFRLVSPY